MITVRFPSGFCVEYPDAYYALRFDTHIEIWNNNKKQRQYAHVPHTSGALIEYSSCGKTYGATHASDEKVLDLALDLVRRRATPWGIRNKVAALKSSLDSFDGRKKEWKG